MNRSRKRRMYQACGLSFILLLSGMAYGQTQAQEKPLTTFKQFELLKVDGKVVGNEDKITFGSPEFVDWDGDGRTDLILGYWASWGLAPGRGAGDGGKVRFYKNRSKSGLPEYEDRGDLQCGKGLVRLKEA